MKAKKTNNTTQRKGIRITPMWVFICMAAGAGIIFGILELLRSNGLELLNQYLYYILRGTIYISIILALMFFLRKKITHGYIRRMITILCVVCALSVGTTVFSWMGYLPYHYATMENNGNQVAIMCHMTMDPEVSERLNAASAQFMADAEAAAAEAQAKGESIEEVPNTVTGMDLLSSYAAYPIKYKFFFDANADIQGRVYTLFGATSAELKIDWPSDNTCRLYAEGAEAEGEAITTIK